MPNQLSRTKRRQSIAEHRAVLATIETIARRENRTVVDVLREAIRELIKRRANDPSLAELLRSEVWKLAPRIPANIRTPAQVSRFKREQREFDQVILDLNLAAPMEIEARNSIARPDQPIRLIGFANAHAAR
jgi:hypothetical protein